MIMCLSKTHFITRFIIRNNAISKCFYIPIMAIKKEKQFVCFAQHLLKFRPIFQHNTFCSTGDVSHQNINTLSAVHYETIVEETLQNLMERFEEILDFIDDLESDVSYSNGVLTVSLGEHGTYVINKQSPNKQIWLSSPVSGPKRYDYMNGVWIYKHDGISLHELLTNELSCLLQKEIDFNCISK